jgi:hypothetical protein
MTWMMKWLHSPRSMRIGVWMKICEWCYMVVDHFDLDHEI